MAEVSGLSLLPPTTVSVGVSFSFCTDGVVFTKLCESHQTKPSIRDLRLDSHSIINRQMMNNAILKLQGVNFAYGEEPTLQNITFELEEGEMLGLVGANSSGKSTLLRLISGVLEPQSGSIQIYGESILGEKPPSRARLVATVPQNPTIPPNFSVLETVLLGRTPHLKLLQWQGRNDLAIVRHFMELTECWSYASRPIGELSGGERQRVLIARALSQETPLLLLDEPTASLDIHHQTEILSLMQHVLEKRRGAVLIAIHDLNLAAQYCHRLVLLHEGNLVSQGTPADVLNTDTLKKIYGDQIVIDTHPLNGKPIILPTATRSSYKNPTLP
jgi:iron complex transport system ATP-binding protein